MNRKKLLMFGIPILALMVVSASVLLYLGQVQQDVTVNSAVIFTGDNSLDAVISGGESVTSNNLLVESQTSVVVPLSIETISNPNETGITHTVNYLLDNSAGTCLPYPFPTCEKRVFVSGTDANVLTLGALNFISWDAVVSSGYLPHVDIIIDTNGDGVRDDALVFEYAKEQAPYDNVPYPTGSLNTFGDKGSIDDGSRAWLSSGAPGDISNPAFIDGLLSQWKSGTADNVSINGNTIVLGFEFEVDNWISSSNSTISNILINGNPIEVSLEPEDELAFNVETEFGVLNVGTYKITTTINPR